MLFRSIGSDSFTFRVNNGTVNSAAAAVNLTIQASGGPAQFLPAPILHISGPLTLDDVITISLAPGSPPIDSFKWSFIPVASLSTTAPTAGLVSQTSKAPLLSLANLGLHVGTYQVRVQSVAGQAVSSEAVATLTIVSTDASGVRVFPNPWRSDQDSDVNIIFDNLTPGATVKIFDMAAHWVRTLTVPVNQVPWDRRNDNGDEVASGMYIYLITQQTGQTRGKLTIIK